MHHLFEEEKKNQVEIGKKTLQRKSHKRFKNPKSKGFYFSFKCFAKTYWVQFIGFKNKFYLNVNNVFTIRL